MIGDLSTRPITARPLDLVTFAQSPRSPVMNSYSEVADGVEVAGVVGSERAGSLLARFSLAD